MIVDELCRILFCANSCLHGYINDKAIRVLYFICLVLCCPTRSLLYSFHSCIYDFTLLATKLFLHCLPTSDDIFWSSPRFNVIEAVISSCNQILIKHDPIVLSILWRTITIQGIPTCASSLVYHWSESLPLWYVFTSYIK